ncbi:MAG: helix-turn-helix domain-containing protein [Nevskiales bacterium]
MSPRTSQSRSAGNSAKAATQSDQTILSQQVASTMASYFKALNGHKPNELYRLFLEQVEAPLLRSVLDYSRGNQSHAAEILGLNRATLRKKLRQYDIQA